MNSFTNYLEKLGSNFLVASMIPSLGLVIACLVVFDPIFEVSSVFEIEQGIYSLLGVSILVAVPTVIIGFTLTALNTFILKLFEGYVFFHHFPFMKNGQERKAKKLVEEREELKKGIDELTRKRRKSEEEKQLLESLILAYYSLGAIYDQSFPPIYAEIMPTKFGNILKASEAYAVTRYGIDSVQFWPRLWYVIPPSYQQRIDEARNELSFLVNMSTLSVVFYILCTLAILINAPVPGSANWDTVIENSFRYIVAGSLALLSNWFFNRAAIYSVGDFGMMIRSSYDLFRLDLLEQFRLTPPRNSVEEFKIWKNLGELVTLGQDSIEFKPLKYEPKKQEK